MIGSSIQWFTTINHAASTSGFINSLHNGNSSSTSNAIISVTGLGQGTGTNQRVGNRVQLLRLTLRGITYLGVQSTANPNYILGRIVVISVPSNNGAGLAATGSCSNWQEMMADYTAASTSNIFSTWRSDMVGKRFHVLWDKIINPYKNTTTISGVTGATNGCATIWKKSFNLRKHFKGQYTTYNTTTTATATEENNHIYIFFISNAVVPVSDPGTLDSSWCFKLSYLP